MHRDYQGSILAITNEAGTILEKRLFDAWGAILQVQDGAGNPLNGLTILDRGYTGHEHLQSVGLIHMNGRLYDPKLHRFLQPDNYVQDPSNTQNFNRYGYCWNNPLKFTDPSGEFIWLPVIIGAVIGAYSGGTLANNGELNPFKWEANIKTLGYVVGGAIVGGISGYAANNIAMSGVAFANTQAIIAGSFINSMGTFIYTGGQTDMSVSFGVGSFNFTTGEFGYFGKKGNSFMENLGYGLGALVNLRDVNLAINTTNSQLYTDNEDAISHSAFVDKETGKSIFSFGPDDNKIGNGGFKDNLVNSKPILISAGGYKKFAFALRSGTSDYALHDTTPLLESISVNKYAFSLVKGLTKILPYQGATVNCVNMASLGAWLNGIPNIGIHPYFLRASVQAYNMGIRPDLLSHYLLKQ